MEQQGICGICNLTGSLTAIQAHFMSEHIDGDENVVVGEQPNAGTSSTTTPEEESMKLWTPEDVLLFIRLVEENYEKFNSGMKKNVWLHVAKKLAHISGKTFSPEQVDNKWKGLKKTYKKIKDANNRSGNSTTRWEYFNAMDCFMGKRPEITPVAVCDTDSGLTINEVPLKSLSSSGNTGEPGPSSSSFMKKRKRAASDVQRRHDEKMARYDEFIKLYRQSVEHQLGKKID